MSTFSEAAQVSSRRHANRLFWLCFLSYACSYIGRKNFAACLPAMIAEGFLTKATGGYITTAYMIVYGTGQLLSGIIGSKIKPKYMIGTGLLGAGICNFLMGLSPLPELLPVIWAANGLFHSMLWAPIIRVFTDYLPDESRAAAGTNISVSCSVGAVLAFLIPSLVLAVGQWRTVFYVSGSILLFSFAVWCIGNGTLKQYLRRMEEANRQMRKVISDNPPSTAKPNRRGVRPSLLAVIMTSGLWMVLFCLFCNGALRDAVESWAPTFLSEQFGLSGSVAALISVIIPIISVTGTYIANWLLEKHIHNEFYTAFWMFVVAIFCVIGIYLTRNTHAVICAALMALSVSAMWGVNHMFLTVIPYHFAPLGLSAAATGLFNCIVYFSTACCSGLYGVLADKIGWRALILIWIGIGIAGMLFCFLGGKLWGKKNRLIPEEKNV